MKKFLFSAICACAMFYTTSYQANATPPHPDYDIFILSCGSVIVDFSFEPTDAEMLYYYDLIEEMLCG